MTCKCGREITNVPEHLSHLADWVCRECSNVPSSSSLVGLTSSGALAIQSDLDGINLKISEAA
ncbi:MAG: hypothetical protein WCL39_03000 [Armatimonadota bacterium]